MKQKISKINWIIIVGAFLLETILLYIVLGYHFDISIYNNVFELIKFLTVTIGVDLVFILYMIDFSHKEKKNQKTY